MKNSKNIVLGAVLLTGVFAMAAPASADYYRHVIFAIIDGNFIRTGVSCLETERSYTAIDATARVGLNRKRPA